MKLETFFEKFELFADAPGAVEKMRALVLHLAMTGRLFDKSMTWKAASLPNGWRQQQLGEVAQFINGDRSKNYPSKSFRVDDGVPFINAGHLANGVVALADMDYITPEHFDRLGGGKIEPGDVLFCLRGSLGKCAVVQGIERGAIASSLVIIRPSQQLASRFIYFFLTSPLGARMVAKYDNGSAQPNLSATNVKKFIIPIPPLAEQKRIVAKVDELMALCDRLEAQQQERETRHAALARASLVRFADAPTPANLDFLFHNSYAITPADLRKSILTLAVQGKLVPQDSNDGSAEKILAAVAHDVAMAVRGKRMKSPRPIPAYDGERPFELPSSWAWAPLGTLTAPEDGAMCDGPFGSKLKTEHYIASKGYAVLRLGNIGVGYFIHGKEGYISREHYESLSSNHAKPGDLLVAGLADPLARCCEIPPDIGPAVNKSDCFRVRLSLRIDRSYVRHYLNSPVAKAFAAEENHGMTRERINLANAKALPVPVPPLAEQKRIVTKVEQLMALVDALETQLTDSRRMGTELLEAVVAELTAKASSG